MANTVPIPNCGIELSEGEIVVRCYHITVLRSRIFKRHKARGDIAVTNKRIIYQGKGKSSLVLNEIPIESVSAINTYMGSGFIIGYLLLGIGFIIGAIISILTIIFFILGLILGITLLIKSYNRGYGLTIKSSDVKGVGVALGMADVSVGDGRRQNPLAAFFTALFSTTGQGAVLSVSAEPTKEALMLMNELGALVLDLKLMGDHAIPKWQNHQSGPIDTSILNAKFTDVVNIQGMKEMAGSVQAGMQRMGQGQQNQANGQQQVSGQPHQSASAYNMPFGIGNQVSTGSPNVMPPQGMSGMGGTMSPQGGPGMPPPQGGPGMMPPQGGAGMSSPGGSGMPPGSSGMRPSSGGAGMTPPPPPPSAPGRAPQAGSSRNVPPPPPPGTGSDNGGFFG